MATLYERRDADGNVVERAFIPSARPARDALVREQAAAGVNGWAAASQTGEEKKPARSRAAAKKPSEG